MSCRPRRRRCGRRSRRPRQHRSALSGAGEAKYRLLSAVSHELRTPLTPMALVLSELAGRTDLPPEVQESAEMGLRQVEMEAGVVEELLEYADLMCGMGIRRSETQYQKILSPVRQVLDAEAARAGMALSWEGAEETMSRYGSTSGAWQGRFCTWYGMPCAWVGPAETCG